MRPQSAAPRTGIQGGGKISGDAKIVPLRPSARIVEALHAVGLHVELQVIDGYVVPIVTKVS